MEARQTDRLQLRIAGVTSRVAHLAGELIGERFRSRGSRALPRLSDAHPWALQTTRSWRRPDVIPVSAIVGTASALPGTRRTDFLPMGGHEPADWHFRWKRLEDAARNLTPLPPVDLVKAGDGYWVTDGHNRVAMAKSIGQLWIDADVTEVILPPAHTPSTSTQRGTT